MDNDLTLDEMILQYSENPFVDEKVFNVQAFSDHEHKQGILNKLLMLAFNLISPKDQEAEPSSYKRRYSYQLKAE
jgi:hypothetical protein